MAPKFIVFHVFSLAAFVIDFFDVAFIFFSGNLFYAEQDIIIFVFSFLVSTSGRDMQSESKRDQICNRV